MKSLILIIACFFIFSFSSCKRTFVCGCSVHQTTTGGADTTIDVLSHRFIDYKANAKDYCDGEFTDSLKRQFGVSNTECFVNGVGM